MYRYVGKRIVDLAIALVWLHPFNLAESEELRDLFFSWLASAAQFRDEGGVEIVTMGDFGWSIR